MEVFTCSPLLLSVKRPYYRLHGTLMTVRRLTGVYWVDPCWYADVSEDVTRSLYTTVHLGFRCGCTGGTLAY